MTEEEKLNLLDQITQGNPVAWGRQVIAEHREESNMQEPNYVRTELRLASALPATSYSCGQCRVASMMQSLRRHQDCLKGDCDCWCRILERRENQ